MLYLGILGLEFYKVIIIFEINALKLFLLQNFAGKKSLNLRLKVPYLGTFGLEFNKTIVIFEIDFLKFV